ncbi:hypothetical protein HK105_205134 [Polyrhizophydium stewartii]|uniref:Fungal lipase-type domain-containing protein n=1 Tax=Polyrhizophydium stewartii TaxID=2732419 RepID=A0ABR4N729_9FUNG
MLLQPPSLLALAALAASASAVAAGPILTGAPIPALVGTAAQTQSNPLDNTQALIDLYNQQAGFTVINKRSGVPVDSATQERLQTFTQYSSAAYCPSVIGNLGWICGSACSGRTKDTVVQQVFNNFFGPGTAGYVAYNTRTKQIITAFRGSVSVNNWLENLMLWFDSPDNGALTSDTFGGGDIKLHKGFQESYAQVRSGVRSAVASLASQHPDYEIVFTGHSLGAAIAAVAAVDVYLTNTALAGRMSMYTYGQPRVGNTAWANYVDNLPFASRIYRVTGYKDIVPNLPFELPGLDYTHNMQQYTVHDSSSVKCENNGSRAGETKDCNYPELSIPGALDHVTGYFGWPTIIRVC